MHATELSLVSLLVHLPELRGGLLKRRMVPQSSNQYGHQRRHLKPDLTDKHHIDVLQDMESHLAIIQTAFHAPQHLIAIHNSVRAVHN
jgi:hypothetical protein